MIGIIGGNGFIGKNFCRYISEKGQRPKLINKLDFNATEIKNAIKGLDVIYDFSVNWGGDSIDQIVSNAFGPFLLASLLGQGQKLIWVSSSAAKTKSQYGFSKAIAERALSKFENVKIIRLSDVYGPGQSTGEKLISPEINARRIQRFVVAYKLIKEGKIDWVPAHGFNKKKGKINHQIRDDFIYPTFITDVVRKLDEFRFEKKDFSEFYGPRVSNYDLVKTIQSFFSLDITIALQKSEDSCQYLVPSPNLTAFGQGLRKWLSE